MSTNLITVRHNSQSDESNDDNELEYSISQAQNALSNSVFIKLPMEIIIYIFQLFSIRDLKNVSLVCRYFKVIADHDDIWRSKCNPLKQIRLKSYKEIYMNWIYGKYIRKLELNKINEEYKRTRNHIRCQPNTSCDQKQKEFNLSLDTCIDIELSMDINQTVIALIAYLEKASGFFNHIYRVTVIEQMITRYYRFLQLKVWYPNSHLIATLDIEMVWQTHLLRPQMYHDDCYRLFHRIIDHSLLCCSDNDKEQAFNKTCELYEQHFGEQYCTPTPSESDDHKSDWWIFNQSILDNIQCSIPAYSYWDKTRHKFSLALPNNYENPFSFVETDIILDNYWFELYFSDIYAVGLTIMLYKSYTQQNPLHSTLRQLTKSYKRFLYLVAKQFNCIHPTYAIDIIWHAHMQEPLKYASDCDRLFGFLLDHVPWSSMHSENQIQQANKKTTEIWQAEFGRNVETDHLDE